MDRELLNRLRPLAENYLAKRGASVVESLAAGGSAAVYVAKDHARTFALKVYAPELLQGANGSAELKRIELQRGLIGHTCRYLVALHDIVVDDGGCYVEMEYVPWNPLKAVLTGVPHGNIPSLLAQLVEAVRFLEAHKIVHRDIKPENILISPDFTELRLIDLGVVREADASDDGSDATDHGHRRPFIATAQYSSPEYLFRLEPPSGQMWLGLTFYQLGAVLHDLLIKRPLFDEAAKTDNKYVVSMAVLRHQPDLRAAPPQHAALAALAADCLVKDPALRMRLVTWDRFVSPQLEGVRRLGALAAQQAAVFEARRAAEQAVRAQNAEHLRYLKQVEGSLRDQLIALVGSVHKVSGYVDGATSIRLSLRIPGQGSLEFALVFHWDSAVDGRRAVVTLMGGLNEALTPDRYRLAAVAEAHTDAGAATLCAAAIDKIGTLVAHAHDRMTAGQLGRDTDARCDLVSSAGLP